MVRIIRPWVFVGARGNSRSLPLQNATSVAVVAWILVRCCFLAMARKHFTTWVKRFERPDEGAGSRSYTATWGPEHVWLNGVACLLWEVYSPDA